MIRRKSTRSLRRDIVRVEEDVDPNSHLTNIADCMLVVAVGLLVALVAHYGLDLQQDPSTVGTQVVMDQDQDGEIDSNYTQTGTVYYDETTGKYYMVND